ncbi:hypothetical protein [Streptomyces acidiscabies]|uniref:hypothetical protein n=1 Tax=Streptomyces acidiscabies TaxID=42234 RepID=UPI0038F6C3E2
MTIATVNPATGETLKTYQPMDAQEVERRLRLGPGTGSGSSATSRPFGTVCDGCAVTIGA